MPFNTRFGGRSLILITLVFVIGCGVSKELSVPPDRQPLQEFAAMYRGFAQKNKRGPKNLKEIQGKSQGYPNALEKLKSGDLIVKWGSPLLPEGEAGSAVLAYEKNVATEGGNVLMQDGWTIKKMTADEFKSSPNAMTP